MTHVLMVGSDIALLEGLSQSLAGAGHRSVVATTLDEARDAAATRTPLVLIVDRTLASSAGADLLSISVGAGGARLLYRTASTTPAPLVPSLQRSVLADLTLPLERQRLAALVQSIGDRAQTTGRAPRPTPTDVRAI